MKKLATLLLILALSVSCCSVTALAETNAASEPSTSVHLVNPTFLQASGNTLFIADNITDKESVIHIFDVSGTPQMVNSVYVTGNIEKIRLFGDTMYILQNDGYITCTVQSQNITLGQKTMVYVCDIVVADGTTFLLKSDALYDMDGVRRTIENWDAPHNVIFDGTYLRYTYTDGDRYMLSGVKPTVGFDTPIELSAQTLGIVYTTEVSYFTENGVYRTNDNTSLFTVDTDKIIDIATQGTDMFVLTNNNKVYKYQIVDGTYRRTADFVVGSDVVNYTVPDLDTITGYTLAKSNGYPANIVYRTTEGHSVPQLIDDLQNTQYIILDYPGSESCDYYYVFINNSFGWIRKSGDTVNQDSKITVINTQLNSVAQFNAKLLAANTFVYSLPVSEQLKEDSYFARETLTQSIDNPTDVKLLQKFTSTDNVSWYIIEYKLQDSDRIGFVPAASVGKIYSTGIAEDVTLEPDTPRAKINATLFDEVSVFLTSELNENEKTVFPGTDVLVELASDTVVNILKKENNASYIQIVYQDGSMVYGWVSDQYLIPINSLTTNEIVGLSLVGAAAVLIIIFAVAFNCRKKRAENTDTIQ